MPPLLPRGARAAVTVTVSCGAGRVLARCPLQCPTARPCRGPPGSSALSPRGRCRCAAAPAGCAAAGKPRHRRALGGGCAAPWPRGASRCIAERRGTWVAPGVRHRSTPGPLCLCRCISAVPIPCHPQQPNPTRPDPTPAVGQECCLCVRLSTAQHCTALHSTACGPAGTFPHRVPGLWGCGVMGWRCWGGGAGRGLPAAHVVHSWDCSLPPPFRLGGLPLLHGAACAHHVLTVTHPCGAEKGCPPPEVPGTSGCCWLPPRPRCCCEGLPVSSSVPGIPAVPPAHGRGGGTPTDGRSPPGSAASDVCCEHSSARRALNHPAERSVMEDGGCAAVMAAPWGGGRWMRCCREALLSAPPSLPPRHRSLVGTAALWVPFVPVVPTPVLCGRWGSGGGAPLSRPH